MDYNILFDKIDLWDAGRKVFSLLDGKRKCDIGFANGVRDALLAFDESLDSFKEALAALLPISEVKEEELILYLYLIRSEKTLAEYNKRGMGEEVFYESMLDLTMAARRCYERGGIYGLDSKVYIGWSRRVLLMEIFRLGRLEFELIPSPYDTEINGHALKKGELCINTHIPAYCPLTEEACEDAYERARTFYKKHFGIERCFFICISWLMHPWLCEDIGESSSIVRFAKKYKIFEVVDDGIAPINWVFLKKCENPCDYPEDTTIRRKLKARILEGRPFGYGVGVRL
jgi:hypothetical protein